MDKNYKTYYCSRAISGIGDALQDIAVITIIAFLSNSTLVSGMIVSLNAIVRILCSFYAIRDNDHHDCKSTLTYFNYLYAFITILFYILLSCSPTQMFLKISVIIYETICSFIYTFYKIYQDLIVKEVAASNEKIARLYATDNVVKVSTSFISTALLLLMSYKVFLIINAVSFIISGHLVSKLELDFSEKKSRVRKYKGFQIANNTRTFLKQYPIVFKIIVLSALLTFFFASYSILFQKVVQMYDINVKHIGLMTAIYHISSIL